MIEWSPLTHLLNGAIGQICTAITAEVRQVNAHQPGALFYQGAFGTRSADGIPNQSDRITDTTFFDLASLTKLFTATAFFRIVDAGKVTIDTPIGAVLTGWRGQRFIRPYPHPLNTGSWVEVVPATDQQINAESVTFRHLLTHSSGLPAWINLRDGTNRADRIAMCLTTPFAYPTGSRVVYSDLGFILLGEAVAALYGSPLDRAIQDLVADPLGLSIHYKPIKATELERSADPRPAAPTEFDQWRGRRVINEVHDENAASLGGISGHAGLFGTARDVASLGEAYLINARADGGFLSRSLVQEATRVQIGDRGLGWMMRSEEGSSSGQCFSAESYGHTGFTGTSLWIDPVRGLSCALLTNSVFYGRNHAEPTYQLRRAFHDSIIAAIEGHCP